MNRTARTKQALAAHGWVVLAAPKMNETRFNHIGRAMAALAETLAILRAPGGCPWDAEQTLDSLMPYLIEETYEAVDALAAKDLPHLKEELGDVLLQVVFQAEIAQEGAHFDLAAVADGLREKLIRRHPHVFGAAAGAKDGQAALETWEEIKAKERPKNSSRLAGVPKAMPALQRAARVQERAATLGAFHKGPRETLSQLQSQAMQVFEALALPEREHADLQKKIGDFLLTLARAASERDVEPESALRQSLAAYERRFRYVETALLGEEGPNATGPLDALNKLWEEARRQVG